MTECHEAVVPEWADGEEMPCNAQPVAGMRLDEEGHPYPVCAEHYRSPMVAGIDEIAAATGAPVHAIVEAVDLMLTHAEGMNR